MSEYQTRFVFFPIDVNTEHIINIQIYHLIANNQLSYALFVIMQDKYIYVRNVQVVFPLDQQHSILRIVCTHFQYEEAEFFLKFINDDIKWIILWWIDRFFDILNLVEIINIHLWSCCNINVKRILLRWYQPFRLVHVWLEE